MWWYENTRIDPNGSRWGLYVWDSMNKDGYFQAHRDQKQAAAHMKTAPAPQPSAPKKGKSPKTPNGGQGTALPAALRRFYAPRTTNEPIESSDNWAAALPLLLSKSLSKSTPPSPSRSPAPSTRTEQSPSLPPLSKMPLIMKATSPSSQTL